ncbi:MAG: cysteine synthase family protein [Candidatus Latescibacteria bacterium]|nr:cysteine synthase family protein [Candidatus Latescibacterota bacterium]
MTQKFRDPVVNASRTVEPTPAASRPRIQSSLLELVGHTPLLRIRRLEEGLKGVALYAKLEMFNPGGSVKDRPALQMILDGEASGALTKGKVILDSTSGNTGIAYAWIGAAKGYEVELVMPASASRERLAIVKSFGARVVLTDPAEGSDGAIVEARRIYAEGADRYFKPDQYNNPSNPKAHALHTAPEIWAQTKGEITHFVASIGTSGTLMGTGRGLKALNPDVRVVEVEPPAFHGIEGLKHMATSIVPGIYGEGFADEKVTVETEDAYEMTRWLARELGVLCGQSSGAALWGALQVARRIERGAVVVIFPDGGDKYMSTRVWEWNQEADAQAQRRKLGVHL